MGPYGYRFNCKDEGLFIVLFAFLLLSTLQNAFDMLDLVEPNPILSMINFMIEGLLPAVFMVIFMVKMSFSEWSALDVEEERAEITWMDREVGA